MFSLTPARHPQRATRLSALAALALLLASCGSPSDPAAEPAGQHASQPAEADYPSAHIHGMSVDPGTNRVLLATHDGLYDVSVSPVVRIGPSIDLMGFTSTADGTFYASGHPGPGVDLPDPIGLVRSTDGGQTWEPLSRQGDSDFHALTATSDSIIGYDGALRRTADGSSWETADAQFPAYQLAATPRDGLVLATTEEGLQRSADHGATWSAVADAPLLMLTALSGEMAAGVSPDGRVFTSTDSGTTWTGQGSIEGAAVAMAAHVIDGSTLRIWIATETGVLVSNDNGQTFGDIRSHHR